MSDEAIRALTVAAAVGAGLVAGVFFAFSTFVMRALGELPPVAGLRAMQAINTAAPTPLFMAALFGTLLAVGGLAVLAATSDPTSTASLLHFGAAGAYLLVVLLTIVIHVPRNEALALVDPASSQAAAAWAAYAPPWTAWNHLRAFSAAAAAAALAWSLHLI